MRRIAVPVRPKAPEAIASAIALAIENDANRVVYENDRKMLARIVPGEPLPGDPSCPNMTRGTKVLLGDGRDSPGVINIVLIASPDNVWRAVIHCHVQAPHLSTLATVMDTPAIPRWKRAVVRWLGLAFAPTRDL